MVFYVQDTPEPLAHVARSFLLNTHAPPHFHLLVELSSIPRPGVEVSDSIQAMRIYTFLLSPPKEILPVTVKPPTQVWKNAIRRDIYEYMNFCNALAMQMRQDPAIAIAILGRYTNHKEISNIGCLSTRSPNHPLFLPNPISTLLFIPPPCPDIPTCAAFSELSK